MTNAIVMTLVSIREAKGYSQKEVATRMKVSQSKLSKLESGNDDKLRLGELRGYLNAVFYTEPEVITDAAEVLLAAIAKARATR